MSRGAKIAALLAILGMAGISVGTSIVLAQACCTADCEKCPVSFCKDSSADLAKKVVSPEMSVSGVVVAVSLSARELPPLAYRIFEVPRSGFVRPMRN